jgi:hypothetical protein
VQLVNKIVRVLDEKYEDLHKELRDGDMHWFLRDSANKPPSRAG